MLTTRIIRALATASLALAFTTTPFAFVAGVGLSNLTAAAREAESGGKHAAGDNHGGKKAGDDHPGAHNQNGKGKK